MSICKCDKEKWESTCLLTCLLDANKEIFCMSLPKCVLPFLTNQVAQFISCGDIGCFYFSGNTLLLQFLLSTWFQDSIQIKAREGSTFSCLSFVCLLLRFSRSRSIFFIKCPVFPFLDTVQLRWDNIEINNQNKCCHEGARPHQKIKIPKIQK